MRHPSKPRTPRRDPRGSVAIVTAARVGPFVDFIDCNWLPVGPRRIIESTRIALRVYAERDGERSASYPRAVWLQERAGQWSAA